MSSWGNEMSVVMVYVMKYIPWLICIAGDGAEI